MIITFNRPDGSSNSGIVTPANTILPDRKLLRQLRDEDLRAITGMDLVLLYFRIKGKPATKSWEEITLDDNSLPQRIGHRIFRSSTLEAQSRLQQAYPSFFK